MLLFWDTSICASLFLYIQYIILIFEMSAIYWIWCSNKIFWIWTWISIPSALSATLKYSSSLVRGTHVIRQQIDGINSYIVAVSSSYRLHAPAKRQQRRRRVGIHRRVVIVAYLIPCIRRQLPDASLRTITDYNAIKMDHDDPDTSRMKCWLWKSARKFWTWPKFPPRFWNDPDTCWRFADGSPTLQDAWKHF